MKPTQKASELETPDPQISTGSPKAQRIPRQEDLSPPRTVLSRPRPSTSIPPSAPLNVLVPLFMEMKTSQPLLLDVSIPCTSPQNGVGLLSALAAGASVMGAKSPVGTGEEEVRGDCSLRKAAGQWVK